MREILTEDGRKCQSQEQGKGCYFHAAEVTKGSQMVAKQVTLWCLLCPLGSCLIYCQEFLPRLGCERAISRNRIMGRGQKHLLVWKFFYCEIR